LSSFDFLSNCLKDELSPGSVAFFGTKGLYKWVTGDKSGCIKMEEDDSVGIGERYDRMLYALKIEPLVNEGIPSDQRKLFYGVFAVCKSFNEPQIVTGPGLTPEKLGEEIADDLDYVLKQYGTNKISFSKPSNFPDILRSGGSVVRFHELGFEEKEDVISEMRKALVKEYR
jgi:hypothetical protein